MSRKNTEPERACAPRAARPTLKTIAYMTGLGVTTVSRALHDAPDIGQATKERVRLVAKQIGYRPNRAGVRLRTGKTNVISLILSVETEGLGLSSHLVYGVSEILAGSPYHLIVTPYSLRRDPLDPVRYIVETGSADGVIFSRTEPQDARLRYLHEHGFPFATHGRTEMGIEHPFFDFDNGRYGEIAAERLVARGRRRLALVPPPTQLTYSRHMTAGFRRAVERHDLDEVPIRGGDDRQQLRGDPRRDRAADGLARAGRTASSAAAPRRRSRPSRRPRRGGCVIGRDFDVAVKELFDLMRKFRCEIEVVHEDFRRAGMGLAEAVVRTIGGAPATELQTLDMPEE